MCVEEFPPWGAGGLGGRQILSLEGCPSVRPQAGRDKSPGLACVREGRGAGKSTIPGGHILVSEKEKLREKIVTEKRDGYEGKLGTGNLE
jgi:hypothetical protein